MTFPVDGTIPGPNDLLSQSQGQIQTNFANIVGWSAVDHIQYGAINAGTHNQVTIVNPQAAPAPAGTTGEITTQTISGKSELFYTNSTANVELTNTALSAALGAGMLPGGLQIRAVKGLTLVANNMNQSFSLSPAFPNGIIAAVGFPNGADITHAIQYVSASTKSTVIFASNNGGVFGFGYIAIGY